MAACVALLAACATITKGTSQLVAIDTPGVAGAVCTINTAGGPQTVTTPGTVTLSKGSASLPIQCAKEWHERNPVERRSHGRRQRYFRRRDRPWRRRGQRRAQQIPRSSHGGDVARSGLPEAAAGFAARTATNVESLTCRRDSMCVLFPMRWNRELRLRSSPGLPAA